MRGPQPFFLLLVQSPSHAARMSVQLRWNQLVQFPQILRKGGECVGADTRGRGPTNHEHVGEVADTRKVKMRV